MKADIKKLTKADMMLLELVINDFIYVGNDSIKCRVTDDGLKRLFQLRWSIGQNTLGSLIGNLPNSELIKAQDDLIADYRSKYKLIEA